MELEKLQNGSDIRGIGSASELGEVNLTDDAVSLIAGAFFTWLKNKTKKDWKNITICATIISIINKLKNIMEKERRI